MKGKKTNKRLRKIQCVQSAVQGSKDKKWHVEIPTSVTKCIDVTVLVYQLSCVTLEYGA